ncbi:hypothetical protein BDN72DRAFT_882653 [Pluteus cervinus]|uniref:Uncharacterized protein n=1 Tax=Pluteus cervinus TaxID=181527 RepID=A0ACD3AAH5_9AGAR|nr:hypothetical protein BDN72DRAFT_882653 [Pluteus cervinus]
MPAVFNLSEDILEYLFSFSEVTPLSISHVCRCWRRVALASTPLWSTLIFNDFEYPIYSSQDRISQCLERSRTHPLTLDFKFGGAEQGEAFVEVLNLVLRHSTRWRYLYISTSNYSSIAVLFYKLQHLDVPILEHLSVNFYPEDGTEAESDLPSRKRDTLEPSILLGGAPSLKAFRAFGVVADSFQPDLSNITQLFIRDQSPDTFSPKQLRQILSLPNLECLSLSGWLILALNVDQFLLERTAKDSEPITMPHLRHLHYQIFHQDAVSILFSQIIAPNLLSLFLVDVVVPDKVDEFAARSFPNVIQLLFLGCDRKTPDNIPSDYVQFLSLFPNARHLMLVAGSFSPLVMPFLVGMGEVKLGEIVPNPRWNTSTYPESLSSLLTFAYKGGSESDEMWIRDFAGKWRPGLIINPTPAEREIIEMTQRLPELGWYHDFTWPPEPSYVNKRLCTRGDATRSGSGICGFASWERKSVETAKKRFDFA